MLDTVAYASSPSLTQVCFQRHPAVLMRREHWGGFAFHRECGELLEVDEEGFEILATLSQATGVRDLAAIACCRADRPPRLPELARFLQELEQRGFVHRVLFSTDSGCRSTIGQSNADGYTDGCATSAPGNRDLSAPLVAHWAVTYRCNLACSFCYSESSPDREREPAREIRIRIVQRLADWGVFEVALGGGEPTILSDFPELLAAIRRCGLVPNVTTNGVLNSAKILRALAEHAGTVHLSADRSDLLDAARGAGVSDRMKETARCLSAGNVRWGVNLLLTPQNAQSLNRSLIEMQDLGATAVTLLRPKGAWTARNWPGFPTPRDLRSIASSVKQFMKRQPALRMYVDTALRGEWSQAGLLDDPEPDVLGCGGGQRHIAITPNGDVFPCSHARRNDLRMGNLLRGELDQIWRAGQGQVARRQYGELCCGTTCPCHNQIEHHKPQ